MMTRQHFEKVASLLKEFRDEIPQTTFEEIVMEFGDLFLAENERFNDAKFQEACGITWPTFVRLQDTLPPERGVLNIVRKGYYDLHEARGYPQAMHTMWISSVTNTTKKV